jgi:hypothetical protein
MRTSTPCGNGGRGILQGQPAPWRPPQGRCVGAARGAVRVPPRRCAARLQWVRGKAGEDRVHVVVSEEHGWMFIGIYDDFNGRALRDRVPRARRRAAACGV